MEPRTPICCDEEMTYEHGDNGNGGYEYGWCCEVCGNSFTQFTEPRSNI